MRKFCLLLALVAVFFASCKENEPTAENAVSIPLGGNAYITEGQPARRSFTDDGINNWNDSSKIYSVFFRTDTVGKLNLFLKYSNENESSVNITCENLTFTVNLPATAADTVKYLGSVIVKDTGYIKVDMQGASKTGDVYANASHLLVNGDATKGTMHYVNDFSFYWGRRGPSVHMNYPFPEGETIEWFYNEVTVPEGYDPVGTYYMSNGFGEGYFGMQVNSPRERRVLFSVWSPFSTDDPKEIPEDMKIVLLEKGEMTNTGEFGNEGSGGQSYMIYPWKAGETYKFLTRIRPNGKGGTIYTSYFYGNEGKWILVASFMRPKTDTYYKRAHSFLESFQPETGYKARKGYYSNQWACTVDGKWIELTNGGFNADATARAKARMDYKGGVEDGKFFLQNCGFIADYTAFGSKFSRPETGKAPEINFNELPKGK